MMQELKTRLLGELLGLIAKSEFRRKLILFLIIIVSCLLIYNNFIKEEKYYLSYKYKNIANAYPICKVYVDALNTYKLADDFFEAPMQPLSPQLTYPKWEQLGIYDNKDLFIRTYNNYLSVEELAEEMDVFKKHNIYFTHNNSTIDVERAKNKRDKIIKDWQMYYVAMDVDNDGEIDDVIRLDGNRYDTKYSFQYNTLIYVFDATEQKSFQKRVLNKFYLDTIYSFFFYDGETYVKDITYDLYKYGFLSMLIKKFNDKKELVTLCYIDKD
jgi:hypothetical protein